MAFDIVWSPEALRFYSNILQYPDEHWSYSELKNFDNLVSEVLELMAKFPALHEFSEASNSHRCVLTKQVSLHYRVKEETKEIELLVFWDNRQDPEKLTLGD